MNSPYSIIPQLAVHQVGLALQLSQAALARGAEIHQLFWRTMSDRLDHSLTVVRGLDPHAVQAERFLDVMTLGQPSLLAWEAAFNEMLESAGQGLRDAWVLSDRSLQQMRSTLASDDASLQWFDRFGPAGMSRDGWERFTRMAALLEPAGEVAADQRSVSAST